MMNLYDFFDRDKLLQINSVFDQGTWADGEVSGPKDKSIKRNYQQSDKEINMMVNHEIHRILKQENSFTHHYLIVKATPILMLKYDENCHYNDHVDFIHMYGSRTDFTCVMNLNDDYEGGEHYIKENGEKKEWKTEPGKLMVYPTGQVHGVNPITKGTRRCITFWLESAIQDTAMREPIVRFNKLYDKIWSQLDNEDVLELDWFRMALMRHHSTFRD